MAAAEIKLSDNTDAELHPHVVIIANDLERFAAFSSLLEKNGFPCQITQDTKIESPRPGTVYFVSYNLKTTNSIEVAKYIEQQLRLHCIVFAEEEGVQTATKLSSAKMTQTLQYPYTEKNFLMAMQTIVKNRKAQHEKDLRKKQHEERLRAQMNSSSAIKAADPGLIIQKGIEQMGPDATTVFKGEGHEQFMLVQKGPATESFFAIQEGAKPAPTAAREVTQPEINKRSAMGESSVPAKNRGHDLTLVRENAANSEPGAVTELAGAPPAKEAQAARGSFAPSNANKFERGERPMSEVWAIVITCLVGSIVCLYCIYQILFA